MLSLLVKTPHFSVPPKIRPFDFGIDPIHASEPVSAICFVTKGDSPVEIKWFLNGQEIFNQYDIIVSKIALKVSQLTIESSTAIHRGEYTCTAKNNAGVAKQSSYLNINGIIPLCRSKKHV